MKDLSATEAFFLFAVQEKGKIFGCDAFRVVSLVAAILHEMTQSGCIVMDHNKVRLINPPSHETAYLEPFYQHLKEMESTELDQILRDYSNGWSDRHLNTLTTAIGTELAARKLVTKAKMGLFNGRTYFMPHSGTIPALAAELEVNLLYQSPIPVEDGLLWVLIEQGRCMPKNMPDEQKHTLHARVASAFSENPESELAAAAEFTDKLQAMIKTNTVLIR